MEDILFLAKIYLALLVTLGVLHVMNAVTPVRIIDKIFDILKKK